ncbi:hypothetical protein CK203_045074 [Vitis vinifera]|uniref:Uncharacterized protein n=1 Tax=Vitis vinifera TaxID=29760 RepID=A0A438HWP3_VITVI|nr:hypothetical protein CK203_045074 [Vitis vinifera]
MTTLHGSTPSPWKRAEGCVPPEDTIASARDPLTHPFYPIEPPQPCSVSVFVGGFTVTDLDSPLWIRVGGRLSRVSDQSDQRSDQRDMDSQVPVQESTQFDTTVLPPPLPSQSVPQAIPFTLHSQIEVAPPPITSPIPASEDPHTRMDKLEQKLRQMRTSKGAITWEDFDGAPVASLPAKFRMPEIERYTGIGCPRVHLRLYSTVMRAHGLDDAQMERVRGFETEARGVSHFIISRWREKISQIIDRPSEKDQISMIMRSLQPRFVRHLMGFPHTDFGSLGKRPLGGQRSGDVGAISSAGMRPSRRYQTVGQTPGLTACFRCTRRREASCLIYSTPSSVDHYLCAEATTSVCSVGYAFESSFSEARRGWIIDSISIQPLPQPIPPRFRMDLHCSYHQGPGHDTNHCTALRHAIQDLIDQGLVNLGQPSVTTNPLPTHSTHVVHPSSGDIHHMDLIEDDSIHMLSWDDGLPEPIVLHDSYEVDGVSLVPQTPAPFSLIPDEAPFQLTHPTPLVIGCQDTFVPFTLWTEDDDSAGREIQIVTRSGRIAQPPPPAVRPFEGTTSHEEVRREDDEVLRQLQSTQARISIWSLLASSSTHRDALIRALSQIRVETTTTPEGLIHMMTAGRATCIVFSDDDLPPDGLDHVRPLYITVGCSGRRVPSVLLDNGSALNVCPLATAIALGFAPSDFGPSTQTVRAYDSTKREVMGTLMIDLQIGPATFSTLFQVLRIPTSFNLLLGRPWIHVAGAILSSLHQKISHSEDDLLLTGFTFDEIQTLEIEDFCRDFVAMSFDSHSSTVVLDMMRGMTFLLGMGLGRRQQGPSEFIVAIDHDTTFGLGFILTEADYRHMARLCKERVRACYPTHHLMRLMVA